MSKFPGMALLHIKVIKNNMLNNFLDEFRYFWHVVIRDKSNNPLMFFSNPSLIIDADLEKIPNFPEWDFQGKTFPSKSA